MPRGKHRADNAKNKANGCALAADRNSARGPSIHTHPVLLCSLNIRPVGARMPLSPQVHVATPARYPAHVRCSFPIRVIKLVPRELR